MAAISFPRSLMAATAAQQTGSCWHQSNARMSRRLDLALLPFLTTMQDLFRMTKFDLCELGFLPEECSTILDAASHSLLPPLKTVRHHIHTLSLCVSVSLFISLFLSLAHTLSRSLSLPFSACTGCRVAPRTGQLRSARVCTPRRAAQRRPVSRNHHRSMCVCVCWRTCVFSSGFFPQSLSFSLTCSFSHAFLGRLLGLLDVARHSFA